jgi:hypothetical protein
MYGKTGMHTGGGSKAVMAKPGKMAKMGKKQSKIGRTKNFKKA